MNALIVGATGYIGSAVARRFKAAGVEVAGIARSIRNTEVFKCEGIMPVAGDLGHPAAIADAARDFDITVLAGIGSGTDERAVVSAVIESCRGSARRFIYTSGTGVLGIESREGQWSDYTFAEDDPFPFPGGATRAWRLPTEDMVRAAGLEGVAGMIIRPPLIYGHGGSTQVPAIFKSALATGSACYIGAGLNLYSNVHVDDLAELYWLVARRLQYGRAEDESADRERGEHSGYTPGGAARCHQRGHLIRRPMRGSNDTGRGSRPIAVRAPFLALLMGTNEPVIA